MISCVKKIYSQPGLFGVRVSGPQEGVCLGLGDNVSCDNLESESENLESESSKTQPVFLNFQEF